MATQVITFEGTTGATDYYAFPDATTLTSPNWTTYRVNATEVSGITGKFSASVSDAVSMKWNIFKGSSVPSNYNQRINSEVIDFSAVQATASVVVAPLDANTLPSLEGSTIYQFYQSPAVVAIPILDANGTAVDLTSVAVSFVMRENQRTLLEDTVSLSKTSTTVTASIPATVASRVGRQIHWSIRRDSDDYVYAYGRLEILYAADPA